MTVAGTVRPLLSLWFIVQQQERVTERDWEVTCVWRWQVSLDFSLGSVLLG